jgi:FkbM family methyltransferase
VLRILAQILFAILPGRSDLIFRACRRYVNQYNGENNGDMQSNGEVQLLRRVLPGAKVIFDVGANVGEWIHAALKVEPSAEYHCFEPSIVTFNALAASGLPQSTYLNNCALAAANGLLPLYTFGSMAGTNSLFVRTGLANQQIGFEEVTAITLDGYCEERGVDTIDFLKIDVEGYELEVLRGARRMLSEGRVKIIQFEYGGCNLDARVFLKDLWEYISTVCPHASFHKLFPSGPRLVPAYRQDLENFQYSNWIVKCG